MTVARRDVGHRHGIGAGTLEAVADRAGSVGPSDVWACLGEEIA